MKLLFVVAVTIAALFAPAPVLAYGCDDAFQVCYATCQEPGVPAPSCVEFCRREQDRCEAWTSCPTCWGGGGV